MGENESQNILLKLVNYYNDNRFKILLNSKKHLF